MESAMPAGPGISVCTLYEGDYDSGVGVLINSLLAGDFEGVIWCGHRGPGLPRWCRGATPADGFSELRIGASCSVRFVRLETGIHFTHHKPAWMLQVLRELDHDCTGLVYFDPDIVLNCHWSFFRRWLANGVALCGDVNYCMPADHPLRIEWSCWLESNGFPVRNLLAVYYNAGMVGVRRSDAGFIELWRDLIAAASRADPTIDLSGFQHQDRSHALYIVDQDTLNMAAMVTEAPRTTVGPDGMSFAQGGFIMAHAIGAFKPWRRNYLFESMMGRPPAAADKLFWKHAESPLAVFPRRHQWSKRAAVRFTAALGRFYSRR
jgi:hypothetical protein